MKRIIILFSSIILFGCIPSVYTVDSYTTDMLDSTNIVYYTYYFRNIKWPHQISELSTLDTCKCLNTDDTIFFTKENGSVIVNKYYKN